MADAKCRDASFGPSVGSTDCRGGFDFTVTFEDSLLTILPTALFILFGCARLVYLFRSKDKTNRRSTYTPKIITCCIYAAVQIAELAVVASANTVKTKFTVAASALNLIASFFLIIISHAEHVKSIRPSFLLAVYLMLSLAFDATRIRTQWLLGANVPYASVLSASLAAKTAILVLESSEKRDILIDDANPPSTESTSGPFNRGFFLWLNSLLLSGWSTALTNIALPKISEKIDSERLAVRFAAEWEKAAKGKKKPSLLFASVRATKWDLLGVMFPRFIFVALNISRPFLITSTLRYLDMPESPTKTNYGYGLVGAFAIVFVGMAVVTAWYQHLTFRTAAILRGGLISLIYRKMTRLPASGLGETSAMALMGNDVETLAERSGMLFIELWANLVTVVISMYLLGEQLGAVCIVPILLAIASLILATGLANKMGQRQMVYQKATQDRLNFTSDVLGSMKAVKMLGFGSRFTKSIRAKRSNDIEMGKEYRAFNVWLNVISNGNDTVTQIATFGVFAIVAKISGKESFSGNQAITVLSILAVLGFPLAELLGAIAPAFGTLACFRRIQEFMLLEERQDSRQVNGEQRRTEPATSEVISEKSNAVPGTVSIKDGCFKWEDTAVLNSISTDITGGAEGSLTMLVGPIGSGKSSFLKAILGETVSNSGSLAISTPEIAYCSQVPWIMNATVRQNIVAKSNGFDQAWYNTVVDACDLTTDFAQLSDGDATIVGEQGVKLSGGQKQRMAMARAVYARKKIALFDDVFSGLDKVTERIVFAKIFAKHGLLRRNGVTVILATHAVHHLVDCDYVIALSQEGHVAEQGTFDHLRLHGTYVKTLDIAEPYSSDDEEEGDEAGYLAEDLTKSSETSKKANGDEEKKALLKTASDRSTFKYYFASLGRLPLSAMILSSIGFAVLINFRPLWVSWWGAGRNHSATDLGYWLGLFAMLGVIDVVCCGVSIGVCLLMAGPNSGKALHEKLLVSIMNAPMSIISNTDPGSLINRFSQDMRFIDMVLPVSVIVFLFELGISLGGLILAVVAVKWLAIALPIVIFALVGIQRFYVRTSKQLRILEIENKAPLFGHFLETINGLASIRAFNWTEIYINKSFGLLDAAQKPWYLLNCIQRWLTLVMDLIVAALVVIMMGITISIRDKINPTLLGVALVQLMNLGMELKGLILQWSMLETSLGAVTRIKTFVENTPSESLPGEDHIPAQGWLSQGTLEVQSVAIQYSELAGPVVRNINFTVKHGQKVGLCGRSGSGKSSTIQALLRMADIAEGKILLDGQDITKIPRELIREKLSCLTQDPALFSNTVRFNADPMEEHSDDDIINALERVGIWSVIKAKAKEEEDPLDAKMTEDFLSHGQRQLFCLGRALLKHSSVLILDEPTSSVDGQTDAAIQTIIRSEFKDRTIVMIAHRLDTLLDFDKIAVLEKGALVEFDSPQNLLADTKSCFSALYRAETRPGSDSD